MSASWCSSCTRVRTTLRNEVGHICCTSCGKIVGEDIYSEEYVFSKDSSGKATVEGNFVQSIQSDQPESIERRLKNAKEFIKDMARTLGVGEGDKIVIPACNLYRIALERNFVKGRSIDLVAGACLYIACREDNKPFLLIEFSEYLKVNVYILGAVFLQLCRVLHLEEHPIVKKLVDPSLFIHRFAFTLLGEANHKVERTAMRIVTSMKRDWMTTGRKPSGICGAALYLSALSHGFKLSKANVVKIVHICQDTLTKRLIEFEQTEAGGLNVEEFEAEVEDYERNMNSVKGGAEGELLCEHKGSDGVLHFAHGLCERCYDEFVKICGGLEGGSDPPAFQRAERHREAKAATRDNGDCQNEAVGGFDCDYEEGDYEGLENDESGNFTDIDDTEIDKEFLLDKEEKKFKKIIWEKMNPDYDEEQKAKEKAAAAAMFVDENCSTDAAKKKGKKRKPAAQGKKARTIAEAVHQSLTRKRVRFNYDRLKELFDEPAISKEPKKETEFIPKQNEESWCSKNESDAEDYQEPEAWGETGGDYLDYLACQDDVMGCFD